MIYRKLTCDRRTSWILSAPRLDCTGTTPAVGYHHFHDDLSLNFQCNRWVQWIGPSALAEVTELAGRCDIYPEWIDGFLGLADAARDTGREHWRRRITTVPRSSSCAPTIRAARAPGPGSCRRCATLYDVTPDEVPYARFGTAGL